MVRMTSFRGVAAVVVMGISLLVSPARGQKSAEQAAQQNGPRAVTIGDAFAIREVSDPQMSPDGQWVAYTVSSVNREADKTEERIWMVAAVGGEAMVLTAEGGSSSHPRWSPDGKYLAFLSERNEGKTQAWLLKRQGGEAQKLTDTAQDVSAFEWAPESKRLVLVLRDAKPEELEEAKVKDKDKEGADKEKKAKTPKPWVVDRLQFKRDTVGYLDRRRTHLYAFDVAAKSLTQLTSGDFDDEEPARSPDGNRIAFTSHRSQPDPDRTYNTDIWVVAADNKVKGARLKQGTGNPCEDREPAWAPDGRWIALSSQLDPKLFQYATKHIAVAAVPEAGGKTGETKALTPGVERMAPQPRIVPDGESSYILAYDEGTQNLCLVEIATGKVTKPIAGRLMLY